MANPELRFSRRVPPNGVNLAWISVPLLSAEENLSLIDTAKYIAENLDLTWEQALEATVVGASGVYQTVYNPTPAPSGTIADGPDSYTCSREPTATVSPSGFVVQNYTSEIQVLHPEPNETDAWYLRVQDGLVIRNHIVRPNDSSWIGTVFTSGDQVVLYYTVPEVLRIPTYTQGGNSYRDQNVVGKPDRLCEITDEHTLQLPDGDLVEVTSLKVNDQELITAASGQLTILADNSSSWQQPPRGPFTSWDPLNGTLTLQRTLGERDRVTCSYRHREYLYTYQGYEDDAGNYHALDLNPSPRHTYDGGQTTQTSGGYYITAADSTSGLLNQILYLYLLPTAAYRTIRANGTVEQNRQLYSGLRWHRDFLRWRRGTGRPAVSAEADPYSFAFSGTEIYVATTGDDKNGDGSLEQPYRTLTKALDRAATGDTVYLRSGSHVGGVGVDVSHLTIRNYPGESALLYFSGTSKSVIDIETGGSYCTVLGLELSGGYYCVKWTGAGSQSAGWTGPTHGLLVDCTLHHSLGEHLVKVTPGCDNHTVRHCTLYNAAGGVTAIDDVNGDSLTVEDCTIYNCANGAGIFFKGGAKGCLAQRNVIHDCRSGIQLGYQTDAEWFDSDNTSRYWECFDSTAQNNIVYACTQGGIEFWSSRGCNAWNNTLAAIASSSKGGLVFAASPVGSQACSGSNVRNNIVQVATGSRPVVHILDGGYTGSLTIDYQRYYDLDGAARYLDERSGSPYDGALAGWKAHVSGDAASTEGDPLLAGNYHLTSGSPCITSGVTIASVTDDVDREVRTVPYDIGADEFSGSLVAPTAPSGLTLQVLGATSIRVSWTDNSTDETGFKVDRSTGGAWSTINTTAANVTSYTDTGLTPSTAYFYRVKATSGAGDSSATPSGTATTTALDTSLPPPTNLTATIAGTEALFLAWEDNAASEDGYRVERGTAPDSFVEIATLTANAESYHDGAVQGGTLYYYRVRATSGTVRSEYSNTATGTATSIGTGTDNPCMGRYTFGHAYFGNSYYVSQLPGDVPLDEGSGISNWPSALVLAKIYVTHNARAANVQVIDTRVRGGGVPVRTDVPNLPGASRREVETYWDLSGWDGQPVPLAGVLLVELPAGLLTGSDGLHQFSHEEIEAIVNRHLAAGVKAVIRYI